MKKTLVINFFGAPGAGKSTGAAYVFSLLKARGVNAELISEFAKQKVWEGNDTALGNQLYVFGKQQYAMARCRDQVDVIVTDAPLMNSVYYNSDPTLGKEFNTLVRKVSDTYENVNVLVRRVKKYNPKGRVQSEARSDEMHKEIEDWLLNKEHTDVWHIGGDEESYRQLAYVVMTMLDTRS